MAKAKVTFQAIIQDSQEYGSNDEHMVSRLLFIVEHNGKQENGDLLIKQTAGTNFEEDPLEVLPPKGISTHLDYQELRAAAERVYRESVGMVGKMIRITSGSTVRMYNNKMMLQEVVFISFNEGSAGW